MSRYFRPIQKKFKFQSNLGIFYSYAFRRGASLFYKNFLNSFKYSYKNKFKNNNYRAKEFYRSQNKRKSDFGWESKKDKSFDFYEMEKKNYFENNNQRILEIKRVFSKSTKGNVKKKLLVLLKRTKKFPNNSVNIMNNNLQNTRVFSPVLVPFFIKNLHNVFFYKKLV